ncbi:MAG: hypothetical protein ACREA9_10485 [Pyrinomonadaceae bacterium]
MTSAPLPQNLAFERQSAGSSPEAVFEHWFASVIPFGIRDRVLMAMLTGYFDESGTDGKSAAVTMGGYVSTRRLWMKFERQWERMLKKHGISELHMTDLNAFRREFADRDKWEKIRPSLLNKARRIIHDNTLFGLCAVVSIRDYKALSLDNKPGTSRALYAKLYDLCGTQCVIGVARWARRAKVKQNLIEYVFERPPKGMRHQLDGSLEIAKNDPIARESFYLLDWDFKDKRTKKQPHGLIQLNAADILANQTCQVIADSPKGIKADILRPSLKLLIRAQDKTLLYFDKRNLPELFALEALRRK